MKNIFTEHKPIWILLFGFVLLSIFIGKDFGIGWDEPLMRDLGYDDYNFITKQKGAKPNPFYGTAVELPMVIGELKLGLKDSRSVYLFRHYYGHFLFLISALFFYFSVFALFKKKSTAFLAAVLYLSCPMIYVHSYMNSKDLPFLGFFVIFIFFLIRYLNKNGWLNLILLTLAATLLIDTRLSGLIIYPAMAIVFVLAMFLNKSQFAFLKTSLQGIVFLIFSLALLVLVWPVLWTSRPDLSFLKILDQSVNFNFWGASILSNGQILDSLKLPIWYLPGWMAITIPIAVLFFAIFGFISFSRFYFTSIVKNKLQRIPFSERNLVINNFLIFIFIVICFFVPFLMQIINKTPIFDGWRHMFFLYTFVLFFASFGLYKFSISKAPIYKFAMIAIIPWHCIAMIAFHVKNHPLQNVYFNAFVSKKAESVRKNWEMDYWGQGNYLALKYILKIDNKDTIRIASANPPGRFNMYMFDKTTQDRMIYIENDSLQNADYFITDYRWHRNDYPLSEKLKDFKANNSTVISVFRINPSDWNVTVKPDKKPN